MIDQSEYLNETLADEVKSENNRTAAARQAKKMGLVYAGFGRYLDAKGSVAYVVQDGKLVPYKGLQDVQKMYDKVQTSANPEKTAQLRQQADTQSAIYKNRQKEDDKILRVKAREVKKTNTALLKAFTPELFTEDQLAAIQSYAGDFFESVNRYLYKGHDEGVDAKRDSDITAVISSLDAAFDSTMAPFPFTTYTALSGRYRAEKIAAGEQYLFRGYLSTSLDPTVTASGFSNSQNGGNVILQIEVQQGQKAIYTEGLTDNQGDMETLLPRGSMLEVVSGPHQLDPSILDPNLESVLLFHCVIVEE